jgi:hypothetical protein
VNNLHHFVAVEEHVNHLKDGDDHEVMMMKIMNRMKIHQHLQIVHHHGQLVVDKLDEVVEMDQWISEQNQMINGILMMIDLVDTKKKRTKIFISNFIFFSKNKKVNQINNVDGDRMHLCLIVILIYVVHKLNEIVKISSQSIRRKIFFFFSRFRNARMDG